MLNFMQRITGAKKREEGASAVEYGLLVALIAIVIIGAVTLLGTRLSSIFQDSCDQIGQTACAPADEG